MAGDIFESIGIFSVCEGLDTAQDRNAFWQYVARFMKVQSLRDSSHNETHSFQVDIKCRIRAGVNTLPRVERSRTDASLNGSHEASVLGAMKRPSKRPPEAPSFRVICDVVTH